VAGAPALLVDPPRLAYPRALALMRGLAAAKAADIGLPQVLIVTEHEPVVTLGRRGGEADLAAPPEELAARGVAVHRVERGGLATWHGPGQAVAYPVLSLARLGLGVEALVGLLERAAIAAAAEFGVTAGRREGRRGVWAGGEKLGSVGLAVRRGVSLHGLSLNYGPELEGFGLITPCGLAGVRMTSLCRLGGRPVEGARVRAALARHLARELGLEPAPASLDRAEALAGM
jgi:lipoate-protein ligase B